MPVTRNQAREICTKPELELVEASFPPAVNALTPSRLRSKVDRSRKLQDKYTDMSRSQNRRTKTRSPEQKGGANTRTARKSRLFAETRQRFEKRLAALAEREAKD
jgi:hypothetical protein